MKNKIRAISPKLLRKSAINIRDGDFILELVINYLKPKTVLEIGTYRGVSAAVMSQYAKVHTIDLFEGKLELAGEEFDRYKLWEELGASGITLHLVEDDVEKAGLIKTLDFDLAFIDGAHEETVKDDFEMVKRCRNVLFHDVDDRGQPCLNRVFDFVNSLPREEVKLFDIFALWRPNG